MARRIKKETQDRFHAIAILLRNTTWKCGKIERLVVGHLLNHLKRHGRPYSGIKDMISDFQLKGKKRREFLDALGRLEKRHIIKIEVPKY